MSDAHATVAIPRSWTVGVQAVAAALGFATAFGVQPIVDWFLRLIGDAPGALRMAAVLPLEWAIPVLTLVGLGVGHWITRQWRAETGTVTVTATGVTTCHPHGRVHVARDRVDAAFTDGRDLVMVDEHANELLRVSTDRVIATRLRAAFLRFGYHWRGSSDPRESAFTGWVDGAGPLDARAHDLLRARHRALADKRPGAAADARDDLRALGVAVRDRGNAQQYRVVPKAELGRRSSAGGPMAGTGANRTRLVDHESGSTRGMAGPRSSMRLPSSSQ